MKLDYDKSGQLARLFKAFADPTRLRLVAALLEKERCVHELAEDLELEQSAVSHQLRVLRDLDLATHRREGRHIYYSLDDDHVRDLFRIGLTHLNHKGRG
ncbi:MAG: winged helix-turn-helix transcriptional regulator [Deltaproteobacteria bacterium]|nr:winged helix-turn-helix transcriptional regulator [Deltaproteobacteria bacterium]